MSWSSTSVRTISSSKVVHAHYDQVLQVLHDPVQLIELNPLVIKHSASSSDPDFHTITDKFTLLGFVPTRTTYTARFQRVVDGVDTDVRAGAGTVLKNRWRARAVDGGTEVTEEVVVETHFLLMPFTAGTLKKSHHELLEKLTVKLEGPPPSADARSEDSRRMTAQPATSTLVLWLSLPIFLLFPFLLSSARTAALYTSVLAALVAIIVFSRKKSKDPYSEFHLSLNKLPGDASGATPRTEWLNMGYWKNTAIFPEACEALALKLVEVAKCETGGNVLDVGHGSGESLLLQLSHPLVPRPSRLTGITSLLSHHERSRDRIDRLRHVTDELAKVDVELYHGDAIHRPSAVRHPLGPSLTSPPYSSILALDCAYHFDTRREFLQQSYTRLAPSGRIALADISFSSSSLQSRRTKFITSVLQLMPSTNIISTEQYIRDLTDIGYVDVVMEDISEDVFPGFTRFLKAQGWGWWFFANIFEWYASAGARFVIVGGTKGPVDII